MIICVRVRPKSQFTIGFFHIILCWRLIQTKNMIMQIFTLQILRVFNNLLSKKIILLLCEDCPTGSTYFTYICFWFRSWMIFWIWNHYWFLSGKYHLQCRILTILYVTCYRPVILSMTWSCLCNVLSLPVLSYNVGSLASNQCHKPHRSNLNQRILYFL